MARRHLIALSIALHLGACMALYLASIWELERLDVARAPVARVGVLEARWSVGRPPAAAVTSSPPVVRKPTARIVRVLVQPVVQPVVQPIEHAVEPVAAPPSPVTEPHAASEAALDVGAGSATGSGDGDGFGDDLCRGGACSGSGDSAPVAPAVVAAGALGRLRISGETHIHPTAEVALAMAHANQVALDARFQICISETGAVVDAQLLSSSRYPTYDRQLRDAMLAWRYRPYSVDGRPTAVCSVVAFLYKFSGA